MNTINYTGNSTATNIAISDAGFKYTLALINGKYKMIIIYWLAKYKSIMRYGELKRALGSVSHKTLSNTLKELEADSLIIRKEYPQIPPKVEYRLSEHGNSLIPLLDIMCSWGNAHQKQQTSDNSDIAC